MSKRIYQRQIPIFLAAITTGVILVSYFSGYSPLVQVEQEIKLSASIMSLLIGVYAIVVRLLINVRRVRRIRNPRIKAFQASAITIIFFIFFLILGISVGSASSLYGMFYKYFVSFSNSSVNLPWMLGGLYYVYRYMRPRTIESVILFIFFFFTFIRGIPAIIAIWPPLYDVAYWIETVPAMSVIRTFVVSAAIGTIIMGVRVLVTRERGIMELEVE